MSSSTVAGACLCGAVRFSISLPTLFCGHCHCTLCQRNHGASYVTWIAVPRDRFTLEAGEETLHTYVSSTHGTRKFCTHCGTSLFCESRHHPDQVDIPLANLEGPIDRPPQLHIYFDDRAAWTRVADDLPRLGGSTGMEPIKPDEA